MKNVLVTGVYGLIGSAVYKHLVGQPDLYGAYGVARRRHPSVWVPTDWDVEVPVDRFRESDLSSLEQVTKAVEGMDVVVHMAAEPRPSAGFERILASNIIGTYNVFEACRLAGVRRVVYASTIMVSFGYLDVEPYKAITEGRYADVPVPWPMVTHLLPPCPRDIYASSKVYGESLAQTYAYRHGLSCLCLRIGSIHGQDRPVDPNNQAIWCSHRDIVQLVERCINAPDSLRFDTFYGVSDNYWGWVDIEHARQVVGYAPQDHGEDYFPAK